MIGLAIGYCIYAALLLPSAITWLQSADLSLLFDDIAKMQFLYNNTPRKPRAIVKKSPIFFI